MAGSLQQFKDSLAMMVFGMTALEAQEKNICIDCKKPIRLMTHWTELEHKEYQISALCPKCFDKVVKGHD